MCAKKLSQASKNILTREMAHKSLSPFYDDIIAVIQTGLNKFMDFDGLPRACARPRTLANVLNDCICSEAVIRFHDMPEVKDIDDYEGHLFVFQGLAALRFKKVDGAQIPSNVPTERQADIELQQLEIPGCTFPTLLNVGYEPNILYTEIKSVSLSCRRNRSLLWEIPLVNDMTAYMFDNEGKAQPTTKAAPIVRPKLIGKVANG